MSTTCADCGHTYSHDIDLDHTYCPRCGVRNDSDRDWADSIRALATAPTTAPRTPLPDDDGSVDPRIDAAEHARDFPDY